ERRVFCALIAPKTRHSRRSLGQRPRTMKCENTSAESAIHIYGEFDADCEPRRSTRCQSKQALICRIQPPICIESALQRLGKPRFLGALPQAKPDLAPSALNERWVLEFGDGYSGTSAQSIPMMRFSAKRFSDFGKIRYRASLLSLNPTIPKSVPLSLFRIVITRVFLICAWR